MGEEGAFSGSALRAFEGNFPQLKFTPQTFAVSGRAETKARQGSTEGAAFLESGKCHAHVLGPGVGTS